MSSLTAGNHLYSAKQFNYLIINKVGLFLFSGLFISAAVIFYSNNALKDQYVIGLYTNLELAIYTLVPYMIAAVVSAITSIGIINMIPYLKAQQHQSYLLEHIRGLGDGDLLSISKIDNTIINSSEMLKELRYSVGQLNSSISQIKIINRQQWEYLQTVKQKVGKAGLGDVSKMIGKMEENWVLIGEIEEDFKTG